MKKGKVMNKKVAGIEVGAVVGCVVLSVIAELSSDWTKSMKNRIMVRRQIKNLDTEYEALCAEA